MIEFAGTVIIICMVLMVVAGTIGFVAMVASLVIALLQVLRGE